MHRLVTRSLRKSCMVASRPISKLFELISSETIKVIIDFDGPMPAR